MIPKNSRLATGIPAVGRGPKRFSRQNLAEISRQKTTPLAGKAYRFVEYL